MRVIHAISCAISDLVYGAQVALGHPHTVSFCAKRRRRETHHKGRCSAAFCNNAVDDVFVVSCEFICCSDNDQPAELHVRKSLERSDTRIAFARCSITKRRMLQRQQLVIPEPLFRLRVLHIAVGVIKLLYANAYD